MTAAMSNPDTTKTDAEIYEDVMRRRWPYTDRFNPWKRANRRPGGDAAGPPTKNPKPLAPGGADLRDWI